MDVWEDVASGYWTLPIKQSSGLVSHYGSTPSSSARPLDKIYNFSCYNWTDRQRTNWHIRPRMTTGAFDFSPEVSYQHTASDVPLFTLLIPVILSEVVVRKTDDNAVEGPHVTFG